MAAGDQGNRGLSQLAVDQVELELVEQSVARGMTGRRHAGLAGPALEVGAIGRVGEW